MRANPVEIKTYARAAFGDRENKAVRASVVIFALWYVMSILQTNLSGYAGWFAEYYEMVLEYAQGEITELHAIPWPEVTTPALMLCGLMYVMQAVLRAGYVSWCMTAVRKGDRPVTRDIFNGFTYFGRVLALTVVRGVLIYVGLALFVVPGLFFLYRYRLSFYILFDDPDKGVIACMRESARLTRGRRMEMLMFDLSFAGWWALGYFVAGFTIPVVDLWLRPYYGLSYAIYYEPVKHCDSISQTENSEN